MISLEIARFAAIECKLQQSGEESVFWMLEAWDYAQENADRKPTVEDVIKLGMLMEPVKNEGGFRECGVRVGWDVKMEWEKVPDFMDNLMEALHEGRVTNKEFIYQSLGVCHPFRDGNGRTHQILWNWLEGSLDNPTWHKDFWDDPRRTSGHGA